MNLRIFGITYGEYETEYIPYSGITKEKPWRFEYNPMIDIVDNYITTLKDDDYLGIFSWKFPMKTGLNKENLEKIFNQSLHKEPATQLVNLSPHLGNNIAGCGCFMDWSAKGHGEILRSLIKFCCEHTGMKYQNNPDHVVYANQFIARKDVYKDYMFRVVKPSLELLEGELWKMANISAKYTAGVDKEILKKHTGLDFYNYVPFVIERLMMQYIWNKGIKTASPL